MSTPQRDPSQPPLTPAEAARVLWQIGQEIDAHTETVIDLRKRHLDLLRKFRRDFARAILSATGTVEDRKRAAREQFADMREHAEGAVA